MSRARRWPCHASCNRTASFGPTPFDLAQPHRLPLDDLAEPDAEMPDQPARQLLADTLDPAGAEIGDESGLAGRRVQTGGGGAELPAPAPVVVPGALGPDQLARLGGRQRADHDHEVALTGGTNPEHPVACLRPFEQHAVDDPREQRGGRAVSRGLVAWLDPGRIRHPSTLSGPRARPCRINPVVERPRRRMAAV